eukprot:SAG31_NODE_35891_length_318_cov_1.415525_1_plen_42_part_01
MDQLESLGTNGVIDGSVVVLKIIPADTTISYRVAAPTTSLRW